MFCASSIAVALFTGSPAEFAFAFETGVDAIATSIVLWRFSDVYADSIDSAAAERTERIASLCVSYAIVFLGVSSIAFAMLAAGDADARHSYKSISHQAHEQEWREQEEEMGVQMAVGAFGDGRRRLGALQLFLGGALGSPSLEKDAIITTSFGSAVARLVARGSAPPSTCSRAARSGGSTRSMARSSRPHPHRVRRPERRRRALRLRRARGCEAAPACTRAVACLRPVRRFDGRGPATPARRRRRRRRPCSV